MEEYRRKYDLGWSTDVDEKSIRNRILKISKFDKIKVPDKSVISELAWKRQAEKLITVYQGLK